MAPSYLARWLQLQFEKGRFAGMCRSWVNQASITKDQLSSLSLPLPPLDEQRRIATILDKADALRRKRKRALDLLDSLKQSTFVEMFGDAQTSSYEIIPLSDATNKITDGAHFTPTYTEDGIPFLRVTDIQSQRIDWSSVKRIPKSEHEVLIERCRPEIGDVLLSKNGTIGISKLIDWPDEFSIFVSLCLIKTDKKKMNGLYLRDYLRTGTAQRQLRQHAKTGTVTNLHLVEIRDLKIPLPTLTEQAKWSEVSAMLQARSDLMGEAVAGTAKLFSSLQSRAFSGQL